MSWFRQAGLAFGNSIWASSLVLSAFMAGLALGNALAIQLGRRSAQREVGRLGNPVRAYAYAEAAIALTGVGLVYLFPVLGAALAPVFRPLLDRPWLLNLGPRPNREIVLVMTKSQMEATRWILLGGMPGGILLFGLLVWGQRRH